MADETSLELKAPEPVAPVAPEKAAGLVPISDAQRQELEKKADLFIADLLAHDANSPEFGKRIDALTAMGRTEIMEAAGYSNRFLDRPVRAIDPGMGVGADLTQLRRTVEDLDPSRHGDLLTARRIFGIIPWGSKLRVYFDSYKSAQSHIATILARLESGKDELTRDNVAIDVERANIWKTMGKLEQMIHVARVLDSRLEAKAIELDGSDATKAKAVRESALFYIRQRATDLLTQMAVTIQGYLALDLVKKNNIELIKGVDRASTTTVAALRTAVTVAQALTNQKLVLQQIEALNTTTAKMIDSTGEMLRGQTAEIHKQATSATIPLETLKRAFENIYATMDSIDTFKVQALGAMRQTVDTLSGEIEKSKTYLARAESAGQGSVPAITAL